MTSIGDLLCRTDALLEKYEKYDTELSELTALKKENGVFEEDVRLIEQDIRQLMKQAAEVSDLKNRATVAAKNAEIRRAKNHILQTRIPNLEKKLRKGKGVTSIVLEERERALQALDDATRAIPDGIRPLGSPRLGPAGPGTSRNTNYAYIEGPGTLKAEEYRHTEETRRFEEDWEESKRRQDEALSRIERGIGVLGNLARDMNQEVALQNPILDAMEEQLDRVKGEIKTRNRQMKDVLSKLGSTQNICMQITLIVILLALAAYIYSLVA